MNKEEIIKEATASCAVLVRKYREAYAAMLAAGWRGDIPTWDEHRKVIDNMWPEIQATVGRIFNWAVAQLKPRYTGGEPWPTAAPAGVFVWRRRTRRQCTG